MPLQEDHDLQSILFSRDIWTIREANSYLVHHQMFPKKDVHVTKSYYRYRLMDPKKYTNFYSKQLKNGITLVYGII
jgi:hypothetical protein